uniref:7TM_GPCR_Srx domain-containing protein n=1 Tax=Strongyloides stercoralis TaxID=6248 RepID=A0A0K0EMG4_STRER
MNSTTTNKNLLDLNDFLTEEDVKINRYICIFIFLTNLFSIIVQLLTFYLILKKRQLLKNTSHKLQISIGICLLIQEIAYITGSLAGIFNFRIHIIPDVILGALLEGALFTIISLIFLLTLNAFDVFYKKKFFINICRKKFFKYGNIICFIWGGIITIFYTLPKFSLRYSLYYLGYEFQKDNDSNNFGIEFESKFIITFLSFSFLIYISIIIKICKMRRWNKKSKKATFIWSDVKFIVYTLFNFFFYILCEFLWQSGQYFLPDSRYTGISINTFFRMNSCINILIITFMIVDIKKEITSLLFRNNENKTTLLSIKKKTIVVSNNLKN